MVPENSMFLKAFILNHGRCSIWRRQLCPEEEICTSGCWINLKIKSLQVSSHPERPWSSEKVSYANLSSYATFVHGPVVVLKTDICFMYSLNKYGLSICHVLSSIRRCEYLLYMVYDLKKSAIQWKIHYIKEKRFKKKKKKKPYKQD